MARSIATVVQRPSIVTVTTASANTDLARWVTDVENTNKCSGVRAVDVVMLIIIYKIYPERE